MATEKLIVKNFGPIKDAELDLKKVTVLIGEQASGKSVLAKLIAVLSELNSIRKGFISFNHYNIDRFSENSSELTFDRNIYKVIYRQKQEIQRFFRNEDIANLISNLEVAQSKFFEAERKNEQIQIKNWEKALDEIFDALEAFISDIIYIPAERLLVSTFADIESMPLELKIDRSYILQFKKLFEYASSELKENKIDFLNINYKNTDGFHQIITDDSKYFNFNEVATGYQSVIPIVNVVKYKNKSKKRNLFIIDEPELSLYPNTQKELLKYLVENCTKGDNRLIITTHSPYILTALNNLIEASNVVKKNPEAADEVAKIIPPQYHIDFEDVAAYFVANGTAKSIMNTENQLIDANALDEVSNDISEEFGKLLQLEFQNEIL